MKTKTKRVLQIGCLSASVIILVVILLIPITLKQAFGPTFETVEIDQLIGGKLICESEYNADLASWFYDISYRYESPEGRTLRVGAGQYYGRDWNMDEQIQEIGDWLVLRTGGGQFGDRLLIGKDDSTTWKTFDLSPSDIEQDSLWRSEEIYVKQYWMPQETFIKQISNSGRIELEYLYRTGEEVEDRERRLITYQINLTTGEPEMTNIRLIK